MAGIKDFFRKLKELPQRLSNLKVQELLKERQRIKSKHFIPGFIIFTSYNAKFKENTYDKTPLVLVLKRGTSHTLGLNFHWIPFRMRLKLIKIILKLNKTNIKQNKPIVFNYGELKPLLKGLGYAPCIRLYINKRFSPSGVIIKPERLLEVARLKAETFTQGRYSAEQLYAKALTAGKKKSKVKKRF